MKKKLFFVLLVVLVLIPLLAGTALAANGADGVPDIWGYITQGAYILVPALWILGVAIKKTPKIPDWTIPYILIVLGVLAAMAMLGWSIENAVQGVLVAGGAVLINQAYKQANKAKSGEG